MRERTGTLRRPRLFADRRFRVPDLGSGVWILPAQINQFGVPRRSLAAAESDLIDGAASRSCARHSKRSSGSVSRASRRDYPAPAAEAVVSLGSLRSQKTKPSRPTIWPISTSMGERNPGPSQTKVETRRRSEEHTSELQ